MMMIRRSNCKIRFWLSLASAAIVLGAPGLAQATTNLVPNPGFEEPGCSNTPNGRTPVICAWHTSGGFMSQETSNPHSGRASASFWCGFTGCYSSGGTVSLGAITDRAYCASIGPGAHPASSWYLTGFGDEVTVALTAFFSPAPDCTATGSTDSLSESAIGDSTWHELSGELVAPAGTQSALFAVSLSEPCEDFCGLSVEFDDVYVGSDALLRSPMTRIASELTGMINSTPVGRG
jgi:hypothetical protein